MNDSRRLQVYARQNRARDPLTVVLTPRQRRRQVHKQNRELDPVRRLRRAGEAS